MGTRRVGNGKEEADSTQRRRGAERGKGRTRSSRKRTQGTQRSADKLSVRKRIVIGLVIVAVVCIGAYVLSRPRKGSVEYHLAGIKAARGGLVARMARRSPLGIRTLYKDWRSDQLTWHRGALVQAGYLIERDFLVTNVSADIAAQELRAATYDDPRSAGDWDFMEIRWVSADNVRAIGTTNLVKLWEEMIPKIDVAPTNE